MFLYVLAPDCYIADYTTMFLSHQPWTPLLPGSTTHYQCEHVLPKWLNKCPALPLGESDSNCKYKSESESLGIITPYFMSSFLSSSYLVNKYVGHTSVFRPALINDPTTDRYMLICCKIQSKLIFKAQRSNYTRKQKHLACFELLFTSGSFLNSVGLFCVLQSVSGPQLFNDHHNKYGLVGSCCYARAYLSYLKHHMTRPHVYFNTLWSMHRKYTTPRSGLLFW